MQLAEALRFAARNSADGPALEVDLVCGFTPLHLETFLMAHLHCRWPQRRIAVKKGLFGDIEGNIGRVSARHGAVVILEWADFDQRLGFRAAAGWSPAVLDDIVQQVEERCRSLEARLLEAAAKIPVAIVGPTLGIPPLSWLPVARSGAHEQRLRFLAARMFERLSADPAIRIVSETELALLAPQNKRHDAKLDLHAGHPYTLQHADAVAALATQCLFPPVPKKGLITDLDETLWKGILGDAGVQGVSWCMESHSQVHALYQQLLSSLADAGVLIAVASKNDPAPVAEALQRGDILLKHSQIFPIHASWGPKSTAVESILQAWNIAADAVVFVDDSAMELAEVAERFPGIECLRFRSGDAQGVVELLWRLRSLFGKDQLTEEDRLRSASLRAGAEMRQAQGGEMDSQEFVSRLGAKLRLSFAESPDDDRAFELVNKTNQFNLNGRRYTQAEWREYFAQPGVFLLTAAYEDRFGPLGKIAVVAGRQVGGEITVDSFVLSCRAFSRNVEFQIVRCLFERRQASRMRFAFQQTDRNGPLVEFLGRFSQQAPVSGCVELPLAVFEKNCPSLNHEVEING